MRRSLSRPWGTALCAVLLVSCSDDPVTTAPPPPPPAETDTADRAALLAFYNATNGRTRWLEKRNWNTPESIRTWQGVKTNSAGFVTELSLPNNNLVGTLPSELGDLAQLRRLSLYDNDLTGPIPPELGKLSELTLLDLSYNALDGSIPPELGALARVDTLDLFSNELSGTIPATLGDLGRVRTLLVGQNRLTGSIPPELGRLTNVRVLSFYANELTGTIPPELGNLSLVELLAVTQNSLTGSIPSELGQLAALEELYLSKNQLSGELPPELGNLSELEVLWIQENGLSGPLPEELDNLAGLQDLRAEKNELTGTIPEAIGNLEALTRLWLQGNKFTGGLPSTIGELHALESLFLDANYEMAGLLPRSLLNLQRLVWLSYAATRLCAPIDDEFQAWLATVPTGYRTDCDAEQVERLALKSLYDAADGPSWNNRSAWGTDVPVGDWHGVVTEAGRVVELSLPNNGLVGPLPPDILNLSGLRRVDLGRNDLSGPVPGAFAWLSELVEFRVGANSRLDGALPFELTRLKEMSVLDFDGTGLCASPSASFQAWFAEIDETAGAICENPEQVSVSIPVVYLTQAIQSRSGRVRLVAHREALLRVFLTAGEPRGFFEPEVVAVFTGPGGGEVHHVVMTRADDRIPEETDEGDLDLSYNAVIPAEVIVPGVAMVVEVDPEGTLPFTSESVTRVPAAGSDSLNIVVVPRMQLTVVPVMEAAAPDTSALEWTRGITGDSHQVGLLKYAFPFSEFSAKTHATHVTSLDLTSDDGQWGMVLELEALRTSENGTGYYYGAAASVNGWVRGRARFPGWASMGKAWTPELAHEVGHNLNLDHAPCGDVSDADPRYPYRDGSIGVWGYDFRDGSLVSPDRRKDIMGYCYNQGWLSDFHFRKVIDHRRRVEGDAARAAMVAGSPSDVLVLWGGVLGGELRIEPAFSMRATSRLPEQPGPYHIRGSGSDGRSLFSLDFTAGEDEFGDRYFFFTIPIEADWTDALERITLTGPEGLVTLDADDQRRISVVTERSTGRIRAILRDWEGAIPAALGGDPDLEVVTTRGLAEAVRLRR